MTFCRSADGSARGDGQQIQKVGKREEDMFKSVQDVIQQLSDQEYICDKGIATVVFLAQELDKPVLVEGPAGVGKTELAKVVARALGRDLIRLQCYEGLDEAKALYEWEYSKQLLYTQILKEKVAETIAGSTSLADAADRVGAEDSVFFSERFIVPRPLMQAISSPKPTMLLIDEVDKSDPEFEAFLLEILSDFQVTIPEIGTIKATSQPLVFLTSNDAREMSDALKRRCLHLWIDYPNEELEVEILNRKVPDIDKRLAEEVVQMMNRIRELDLKKTPSISETLDWARALLALNADELEDQIVSDTLNVILKYEGDVQKAQNELSKLIQKKTAEAAAEKPQQAPPQESAKKGILH
jgi:MoxR-like ATPase